MDGGLHPAGSISSGEKQIDSGCALGKTWSDPSPGLSTWNEGERENKKDSILFLTFSSSGHLGHRKNWKTCC